jgi:hypothetical protein
LRKESGSSEYLRTGVWGLQQPLNELASGGARKILGQRGFEQSIAIADRGFLADLRNIGCDNEILPALGLTL